MTTATIKPIETNYKGFRFRSRLEARYAVWLDALRFEWRYEHEGYDLGQFGWYIPDFWLPTLECFMEVKPRPTGLNSRECKVARALAMSSQREVWMVFDPQLRTEDWQAVYRVNAMYWDMSGSPRERPLFEMIAPRLAPFDERVEEFDDYLRDKREHIEAFGISHGIDHHGNWLLNAFRAFRAARFEHGENGAT